MSLWLYLKSVSGCCKNTTKLIYSSIRLSPCSSVNHSSPHDSLSEAWACEWAVHLFNLDILWLSFSRPWVLLISAHCSIRAESLPHWTQINLLGAISHTKHNRITINMNQCCWSYLKLVCWDANSIKRKASSERIKWMTLDMYLELIMLFLEVAYEYKYPKWAIWIWFSFITMLCTGMCQNHDKMLYGSTKKIMFW